MMVPGNAAANFADNALTDANVPTGIMTQLARSSRGSQRQGIVDAFSPRTLLGIGAIDPSCPDSAPYAVPGWPGRCSNVDSGNSPVNNVTNPGSNPVVEYAAAPVTNSSIQEQNAAARFGLQLTLDRGTQEQLAREAEAQGAAQGYHVSCRVVENYAPAMPGTPGYLGYSTECSINGGPYDQSAALLIRPGGWAIAKVESQLPTSTYHAPVVNGPAPATTTSTQQSQSQGGGNTQVAPAQAQTQQYPTGVLTMQPNSQGQTTGSGAYPAGGTDSDSSVISMSGMLEGLMDKPYVLIGIAAAVYFMTKGNK